MNLRESQLSSRSVIPLALAIPINRDPVDVRELEAAEERRREQADVDHKPSPPGSVSFYL